MGKFDKKISKAEPDAPNSQKILKKKSNAALAELQANPTKEKERSMKILNWMQRAEESKYSNKAESHIKGNDKIVENKIKRQEKKKRKQ